MKRKHIVSLVLALALLLTSATPAVGADLKQQIDHYTQKLQQMQDQLDNVRYQLRVTKDRQRHAEATLNSLSSQRQSVEDRLRALQVQLAAAQKQLSITQQKLQSEEEQLQTQQGLLNKRIVAMYTGGTASYLAVLFQATSVADFLSRFRLLEQIVRSDVALLHQVQEQRDQVAKRKQQLEQETAHLADLSAQAQGLLAELNVKTAAQRRTVSELDRTRQQIEAQEEALARASAQVTELLQNLQTQYRRQTGKIAMIYPLPYHVPITDPFGMRFHPILHVWKLHTGVDLGAPYGTSIRAADDGVVVYAGWLTGYGNATIIDHGSSVSTLYAHQSQIFVQSGETVKQGQVIGKVGSTGWSTGPHLHFEVRVKGQPVNPADWIPLP